MKKEKNESSKIKVVLSGIRDNINDDKHLKKGGIPHFKSNRILCNKDITNEMAPGNICKQIQYDANLQMLAYKIVKEIKDGNIVKLTGLGSFSPKIKRKIVDGNEMFCISGINLKIERKLSEKLKCIPSAMVCKKK